MEVADQLKLNTLKTSGEKFNTKFDLIVDDGWHHPESQIKSLILLFLPYLNQGGLYIVKISCMNNITSFYTNHRSFRKKQF